MKKLFLIGISIAFIACNTKIDENTIQGKTERESISVVSKVPGRIINIKVKEGQLVKEGDTLAILDIPEVDAKKKQVEGALTSAQAQYKMALKGATNGQLKQLNAKRIALKEQYEFAKKSLARLKAMVSDSLIPQQKYDETFAKYQGALAQLTAVDAKIEEVKAGARNEKKIMALGQKKRALGALDEVNTADKERYIIAPKDMSIDNISLNEGELALPGYALFTGYLKNSTYFRFTVAENKLKAIEKNKEKVITVMYNNTELTGVVSTIKQLGSYAKIATAYPNYDMQESLFEVKIYPKDSEKASEVINKTTVTIKL